MGDFTTNSNDALELALVRAEEEAALLDADERERFTFHPTFTYPIYGDKETIYGYKGLKIKLHFTSGSLIQLFHVSWSKRLPASTVDDVEGILYKFIPPDFLKTEEAFKQRVEADAVSFKPPGEKINSYTQLGEGEEVTFEVYHATWRTPGFRDYHRHMQIFILLFIEAGSYIVEDEDRWEFLTLFEKRTRKDGKNVYHFVGYSTFYPFWYYPDKIRLRLSQFVILPPYHRQSHGSQLYNAAYQHVLSRDDIAELTVEDPSEAFEDLRDKNDLLMLLGNEEFLNEAYIPGPDGARLLGGKLGPPADRTWVEKWRKDLKMAERQFKRLMEMLIQRTLPEDDEVTKKKYRLQVKDRLFRFNFEQLMQLEQEEQWDKLEETYQTVYRDYTRLLELVK